MRIRIVELLLVTAIAGLACLALKRADPLMESLFGSFVIGMLLLGVALAIARTGSQRAFWLAFVIVAGAYQHYSLGSDPWGYTPRQHGSELTTWALRKAFNRLHYQHYGSGPQGGGMGGMGGIFSVPDNPSTLPGEDAAKPVPAASSLVPLSGRGPGTPTGRASESNTFTEELSLVVLGGQTVAQDPSHFMRIGHGAWALLLGWLTGHFTKLMYERSRR